MVCCVRPKNSVQFGTFLLDAGTMASIQTVKGARGNTYRVQIRRAGHRPISKTFQLKREAVAFAAKLTSNPDIVEAISSHTLASLTLKEACRDYLDQYEGRDPYVASSLDY